MNIKYLNIGILHSLIGKNDGVSIVIDQTVNAMVNDMQIPLGNIFFLAAHTSPRFNAETNDIFWHKNKINQDILKYWSEEPPATLEDDIHQAGLYAKEVIKNFIEKNDIDLLIAHNTPHCYNFATAVGLGYYIEELRSNGIIWPNVLVWWHDSYFEREKFANPNRVIQKYLKYLPGTYIDGIAFINNGQIEIAKRLFNKYKPEKLDAFFKERAIVVPNTSDVPWDWKKMNWDKDELVFPPQDNYNDSFLKDIGLIDSLDSIGYSLDDTVILLQHTRVVPRKKIETAIDLAFHIEEKYASQGKKKCVALIVSGHSGDEQEEYKNFLYEYIDIKAKELNKSNVILIFGEHCILSHRDIIVDKKYYKFSEIPAIIASHGGLGTYFSEVEGYGNNLLEMMCFGLPVVINKYEVFKSDIEHLNFMLPAVEDCILTEKLVSDAFDLLNNIRQRNNVIKHNLQVLEEKLSHAILSEKLKPLITKMFYKTF